MYRPIALALQLILTACDTPADADPKQFQPSEFVKNAAWPRLLPLAEFEATATSSAENMAIQRDQAQTLAIRAAALAARARLASGEILSVQERARLVAAAALWTGG